MSDLPLVAKSGVTDDLRSEAASALSGAYALLAIAEAAIRHLPGEPAPLDVVEARRLTSQARERLEDGS